MTHLLGNHCAFSPVLILLWQEFWPQNREIESKVILYKFNVPFTISVSAG